MVTFLRYNFLEGGLFSEVLLSGFLTRWDLRNQKARVNPKKGSMLRKLSFWFLFR